MKKLLIICAVIIAATNSFAQKGTHKNHSAKDKSAFIVKYTCPMHPEIVSAKPGKCTRCGMDLTASKKEQLKAEVVTKYTCPMHADVISDTKGKCSKCGMLLTASKKEQLKDEVINGYKCPMHPDEVSDKPGKCPKCGMALTKKN
jgi:Heavy metal binding domain